MLNRAEADFSPAKPLVLLGAGGHAKVLLGLIRQLNLHLLGVCDPALSAKQVAEWQGLPVLGDDDYLNTQEIDQIELVLGVGQIIGNKIRQSIYERFSNKGFIFPSLIHPNAFVDPSACLGKGVQIMAGAIVQPDARIGDNVIVNTSASIDHDCVIGSHVHVAPGATVCGGVQIESEAFIGAGSVIVQELVIGRSSVVPAGTLLTKNLPPFQKASKRI